MSNRTIITVIIFGAIAIFGIIAIQTYLVLKTWNQEESKFHEKVNIALINTAGDLARLSDYPLPGKDLIKRAGPDYYIVNINNEINANSLEYYLQHELEEVGLTEDFEYGIYDCANEEMVYGKYINYHGPAEIESSRSNDLPTYDEFEYYFGVRFPKRSTYLMGEMSLPVIFSAILFITIFFFIYSMIVILRQKRLSEMQKDFINNMTHEFKTPISTIKISSEVFKEHPRVQEDSRLAQYADIISDQNQRLNNQVEKVLNIARIERSSFELNKEVCDVHAILESILSGARVKIEEQNGTLSAAFEAANCTIQADKVHFSNIIHNLLDNAIKYCRTVPEITVSSRNTKKKLIVCIADKGIGIPKENQNKVFKKFYRVPTGNVHNVKGFGLGLFYIKNVCHAHGWKVALRSEEGKGTEIEIIMPVVN